MFKFYEDHAGKWRWRFVAGNGLIMADSSQGYSTKSNCKRAANHLTYHIIHNNGRV